MGHCLSKSHPPSPKVDTPHTTRRIPNKSPARVHPTRANTPIQIITPHPIKPDVAPSSQKVPQLHFSNIKEYSNTNSSPQEISPELSPVTPPILSEKTSLIGDWINKKKPLDRSFDNSPRLIEATTDAASAAVATTPATSSKVDYSVSFKFYMKDVRTRDITIQDYYNMKECWSNIVNNNLYMYYLLKSEGKIDSSDSLSWVYDTFYKKTYLYDTDFKLMFHGNLKLQSKAFVNIIKFSISVARNITEKKKVDYNMIYDVHKKLDVTIVHYFEIVHVLIETLRECLKILFDSSVETSWKKVMSIILNNIIKIHNHTSVKSSFGLPDFMAPTPSLKSV